MPAAALLVSHDFTGWRNSAHQVPAPGYKARVVNPTHDFLRIADQYFAVDRCEIWGYLGRNGEQWYCRWCISAQCAERRVQNTDSDGDSYTETLAPSLDANTLPVVVGHWHELEGVRIESGPNVEFEYLNPKDQRPIYSLYVLSHEKCIDNVIHLSNRRGAKFDVNWTGAAVSTGFNEDSFELKATGAFTHIWFSGEADVESENEIRDDEIAAIFSKVLPHSDFIQHPVRIDRIDEDPDDVVVSFETRFTPSESAC